MQLRNKVILLANYFPMSYIFGISIINYFGVSKYKSQRIEKFTAIQVERANF
jgi:hypothetical protein